MGNKEVTERDGKEEEIWKAVLLTAETRLGENKYKNWYKGESNKVKIHLAALEALTYVLKYNRRQAVGVLVTDTANINNKTRCE